MSDPSNSASPTPSDPAPNPQTGERWIAVAHLLRPQGRRGELLAEPLTDQWDVFQSGAVLRLVQDEAALHKAVAVTLEGCWKPQGRNAGRLVLKLSGVDSISATEALVGQQLFLPASALPALDAGTYLVRDLLDCQLFDGTRLLGTVTDLQFPIAADGRTRLPDAPDLLVLHPHDAPPDTEPVLIPFVKAWLASVDINTKRIRMHLPPGLFDDADDAQTPSDR